MALKTPFIQQFHCLGDERNCIDSRKALPHSSRIGPKSVEHRSLAAVNGSCFEILADDLSKGRWKDALDELTKSGISLDTTTYAALLRHCGDVQDLAEGQRVHAQLTKFGYDQQTFLGNLLVRMYGKCGNPDDARLVFDRIRQRNVFSWNIIIAAYAENGQVQEAKSMFDKMPRKSVVSWNSMITAYAENGCLQEARELFEKMTQRDVISWNAIITAYAQRGQGKEALKIARLMALEGVKPTGFTFVGTLEACTSIGDLSLGKAVHRKVVESGFQLDVPVANALISMYGNCGSLENAKLVFENMLEANVVSWTSMVAAYAQHGYLEDARELFDRMPQKNIVSWNAMIAAYAQNEHGKEALKVFQKMDQEGIKPDELTFVSTIDACASSTALAEGKFVSARAMENGFHSNLSVGNAIINFYGKCGILKVARSVFNDMRTRDAVSWNALIAAYAQNGYGEEALEMFHSMGLESVFPTEITFVSILSACAHAGLVENGREYFLSVSGDYAMPLTLDHYVCMIDILGRAGQLKLAESLIQSMPFEPHALTWRTFLGACRIHGKEEQAKRAAQQVYMLDTANSAPYMLLSNIITAPETSNHETEV